MPEHEARTRAFYDHEDDEQPRANGRRRRPAADWGVGEDIFDRMPSRRFVRGERRAEHHGDEGVAPRRSEPAWGAGETARAGDPAGEPRDEWGGHAAPQPRRVERRPVRERHIETWDDEAAAAWGGDEPSRAGDDDLPRTVLIETAPEDGPQVAADGRRTIVISGHPDRLPVPRPQRPPRTAVDRIGTSPDRIVGYSVALGFLLILIAILTT